MEELNKAFNEYMQEFKKLDTKLIPIKPLLSSMIFN